LTAVLDPANKENFHSVSGFSDKSYSFMNSTTADRSGLSNVSSNHSSVNGPNRSSSATASKKTLEENLALANKLTGKVMERCVSLAAAEKTIAEEPAFEALVDRKIDGKNWTQWKAELTDAVMRRELDRKAKVRDKV